MNVIKVRSIFFMILFVLINFFFFGYTFYYLLLVCTTTSLLYTHIYILNTYVPTHTHTIHSLITCIAIFLVIFKLEFLFISKKKHFYFYYKLFFFGIVMLFLVLLDYLIIY